jgi:tetratricopeptide (TPR) repeat protein
MNLSIFPPSDLLRQVEGIERGLEKQRRVGAAGWLGLVVAVFQAMVVVVRSDFWDGLVSTDWQDLLYGADGKAGLLDQWPFLLALAILLASVFLISWNRFWLQESREPFRYTFAVDDFVAITGEDSSLAWLRHHLSERLNKRIGRLSILEEEASPAAAGADRTGRKRGAPGPRYESHVHIRGHYGTRVDRDHWVIEVAPRVRIGPKGSAETMAHPDTYRLNRVSTKTRDGRTGRTSPNPLSPEDYEKLLERVYFSVATEIYRQITRDVQHKIDLLPTSYLRATAYLHEAEDYARSNTLVAFDEAERLFEAAIRLYDPARRPWPTSVVRWPGHALRRVAAVAVRHARRLVAFAWRRAAKTDLMVARAETGYANVLLNRRSLAGMSGYRLNPIFESRLVAQRAVDKLHGLPRDVTGILECLFDAYVVLALSWASIGSLEQARRNLEEVRRLLPTRATIDARFAYAAGVIETRPRSKQLRFQRAVELDPASESAQFALAFETEKLWRTKPELETDVAQTTVDEYERVLTLNPGNIVAWGNLGYVHWLLADGDGKGKRLDQARDYFERGRDYKEIKRETYVADIDYGLARVAAETGEFNLAYKHFMSALTAHMAQSTAQSATDSWSSLSEYLFVRIDLPILERFERYKNEAERLHGDHTRAPQRVRDSVLAFVVNDYGEACYNYFKRSYDERYLRLARENYHRSAKLDPSYAIPRHNLYLLNKEENSPEAEHDAEQLYEIEPDWFEAKLAIMWKWAGHHERKTYDAYRVLRRQEDSVRGWANATRAATDEERQAIVFEPSRTEKLPNQLTPYEKPKEARSKTTEAERLLENATQMTGQHKNLLDEREKDRQEALKILRQLVPHQWLWRGRLIRHLTPEKVLMSRAMTLRRWRLNKEWRWEREFDNVHVKALYEWGRVQLSLESPRSPSERIFRHIEAHFWRDNFNILQSLREQLDRRLQEVVVDRRVPIRVLRARGNPLGLRVVLWPYVVRLRRLGDAELRYQRKIDGYNRILAGALLSRLNDDPTSYWALSGLNDGLTTVTRGKAGQLTLWYSTLNRQDRRRSLLRVLDGGQSVRSPALYRWVGDQLVAFRRELDDRRTLVRLLEAAADASERKNAERAAGIRDQLESRHWRGLEGSDLRTCRRVLKARDRDALFRIAKQMRPDDDLDGSKAAGDRLRESEVKAYEKAMASDDPKLVWTVVEPLQRLGEREQSRQALKAYGKAMGPSRDATTLWALADGYKKLEDWKAARETFQQALEADDEAAQEQGKRVRHADLYHWEIARARWGEGSYRESFAELELVTGDAPEWRRQPPDRDEPTVWTRFVAELLAQQAISDAKAYHALRTQLERRQRSVPGPDPQPARRDAGGALLRLVRARRDGTGGPTWSVPDRNAGERETLPIVTPIMLHADSALFPERERPPIRKLTAAYTKLTAEIEVQMGVRIPGVLIRASEDNRHKGRRYVVKLHEIPLFSETAPRTHAEQRIVADGIGPVVRRYLDTHLGHAEVQELLDQLEATARYGDARSIAPAVSSAGVDRLRLVQVLQRLVREAVPVTRLEDILKAITRSDAQAEVDEVVDRVRTALVEQLPRTATGIGLGPDWEATVQRWVQHADGKRFLAIPVGDKDHHERLLAAIGAGTSAVPGAVIVVRDDLRRFVRRLTAPRFPSVPVLARGEWAGSPVELRQLEAPAELVRVE